MSTSAPLKNHPKMSLRSNVVDDLRGQIETSQLLPGERLPSMAALTERYQVSEITIRAAVRELVNDGYLRSRRGSGIYVESQLPGARNGEVPLPMMSNVVAVLSIVPGGPPASHRQSGSTQYIGHGAIAAAQSSGMHALALHPDRITGEDVAVGEIDQLIAMRPCGVIIPDMASARIQSLELAETLSSHGLRVVMYGGSPELKNYDRVTSDHEQGSYEVTRWLLQRGHRRILNLWPAPAMGYWFAQRRRGYERAMQEAGLEVLPEVLMPAPSARADAEDLLAFAERARQIAASLIEYLTGSDPIDALVLATDSDVFRAASALRLFGKEPNGDVALVGYDNYWMDSPEREFEATIPLATVDKRNLDIGAELVQLLLDRTAGQLAPEPQCRVVQPKLITLDQRL
jgi:DNA-binding LacI/PurR family transcriptional regulator/DNA-binding transcriptional regulator YhcF (GntR family)